MIDPNTGEVVCERDTLLDEEQVERIVAAGVEEVFVRSPLHGPTLINTNESPGRYQF